MKIGVVSDTHIPERAERLPPKLLQGLEGVDMIVHAGDIIEPEVLAALKKVCPDVRAVAGNMDPPELRRRLPEKLVFQAGDKTIGVTHGYGPPQRLLEVIRRIFSKDKVDIVIFGHSHQPACVWEDSRLMFNPGSPTDTIFAPYRSYGIIEINEKVEARIKKL